MDEIIRWSAVETAGRLARGDVSVREVTRAHLDRVAAIEPGLNAVVEPLEAAAMAQAEAMDAARPADKPPLWGLPVTIKINVDFKGLPNSNGLPGLNKTACADDAPVVRNIRAGGAVVIGRSSTPEFSLRFFTSNPIYGRTLNPWDESVTSGGSSGGASSAVASGMGVLGHGNDLGGSLRYPAYCCGLATLRPSMGRVPAFNASAPAERGAMLQMMSVQGVIAREVGDVRLAYDPLRARSADDPLWNAAPDSGRMREGRALRVGWCVDPFGDGIDSDVARAVEAAVGAAKQAGMELVEIAPPRMAQAAQTWGELVNGEVAHTLLEAIAILGSEPIQGVINGYGEIFGQPDMTGFIAAQARRMTILREWARMFDQIDALILPVSTQPPFRADQDIEEPDTLAEIMAAHRPLYIVNLLGLPGATVRTLEHRPVPLGVQIVGDRMDDLVCLDVAALIERELAFDLGPIDPR